MALERRRGFKPDHKTFGEFILSEQARKPAVEASNDIADHARDLAPRGEGPGPHYADAFRVVPSGSYTAQNGNRRSIALVTNDNDAAAANEFGNVGPGGMGPRTRGSRVLRRAGAPFDTGRPE